MTTTFIDLLFYNRKLERLVEIDLKLGGRIPKRQRLSKGYQVRVRAARTWRHAEHCGNLLARRHHLAVRVFRHYRANCQTVVRCPMRWLLARKTRLTVFRDFAPNTGAARKTPGLQAGGYRTPGALPAQPELYGSDVLIERSKDEPFASRLASQNVRRVSIRRPVCASRLG